VVGDIRAGGPDVDVVPEFYTPLSQSPNTAMTVVLRSRTDDSAILLGTLRNAVEAQNRTIPLHDVQTYDEILAQRLGPRRYEMLLLAAFGGLALLLAAVGLYGIVSYSVAQRTQEMGLRMAFGASRNDVILLVLRQALLLTGCGLASGLVLAFSFRSILAAILGKMSFLDLPVYGGAMFILLAVASLAAYLPARRAASVNPIQALRSE
jgi:ABC-type antimicrobial peptide transport system permease subunit